MSGRLIHMLRHGETAQPGRLIGQTDCAVSQRGIDACLAQVDGLPFDAMITSDLRRARACAEAIGGPIVTDPRWRELDFGAWDGFSPNEIDATRLMQFWDDPDRHPPPGGERWSALVARVREALRDLPPGDVLVVTHGGAMRAALHILLGFDYRALWAFSLPCAALLSIQQWAEGGQIVGLAP